MKNVKKSFFLTIVVGILTIPSFATDHIKFTFHRVTPEGKDKYVYESEYVTDYYWTEYRDGYDEENYHKSTPYILNGGMWELCDHCQKKYDSHTPSWDFVWADYTNLKPYMESRWGMYVEEPTWKMINNGKTFRTSIKFGTTAHFRAYTDFQDWDYELIEVTVK